MTAFLASHGPRLIRFRLDDDGVLHRVGEVDLDSPIHYVWPHPARRLLYVAASNRWVTPRDGGHMLSVVELPQEGAPRRLGPPVHLPNRPIHMTLDRSGSYLLALFNDPPGMQVRRLTPEGAIGDEVVQREPPQLGVFPHQVVVSPDNAWVLVPARGYDARGARPEDPGALRRFVFEDGQLRLAQVVAPGGGYGFGPRHVDFHPRLPVLYVSLERQNQLQVFRHRDGVIEDDPFQVLDTLAPGKAPQFKQFAGAVHVDPASGFVYVANRDDPHPGMEAAHITGDNTMAAFRLDPATGAAAPPVHSEMDAYHVRTFSLAPPWLVAASQQDVTLPGDTGAVTVPASLTVFRTTAEGRLEPVHRTRMAGGDDKLFWCGFPRAYGAAWDG